VLSAAADGDLSGRSIERRADVSVGVVLAAAGYPGTVKSGSVISGLEAAGGVPDVAVFHAGTALRNGQVVTAGGRVLTVVATAAGYQAAIDRAYQAVGLISFDGMQFRRDIGRKALVVSQETRSSGEL